MCQSNAEVMITSVNCAYFCPHAYTEIRELLGLEPFGLVIKKGWFGLFVRGWFGRTVDCIKEDMKSLCLSQEDYNLWINGKKKINQVHRKKWLLKWCVNVFDLCCRWLCLTLCLTAIFPGEPGLAVFVGAKDNGSGVDNWSYKMCKAPVKSSPPTSNVLQASPNQQC